MTEDHLNKHLEILLKECQEVFKEDFEKKVTFYDAIISDLWGVGPTDYKRLNETWNHWFEIPTKV